MLKTLPLGAHQLKPVSFLARSLPPVPPWPPPGSILARRCSLGRRDAWRPGSLGTGQVEKPRKKEIAGEKADQLEKNLSML